MIIGIGNVTLREFNENDISNKIRWINDSDNNRYLHYDIPLEYGKTLEWYFKKNKETRLDLVIEYENVPIGLIGLLEIDRVNSKAEYYICLGEKQYKGKGIAKLASKALLNHAFYDLALNKVYLNVDAQNVAACFLYEKIGFECEGYFKEDMFHNGALIDRKRYAIFENTWRG